MNEPVLMFHYFLRENLLDEILKLNTNQSTQDFLNFFRKDEVFIVAQYNYNSTDLNDTNKEVINKLFDIDKINKKIMIINLDSYVQKWNKIIYLIHREKSLKFYLLDIIYFSILAKKFYFEKIGNQNFVINECFYEYEQGEFVSILLISNNNLLLEHEPQRDDYISKYLGLINSSTSKNKKRKSIPKGVRDNLWIKYFTDKITGNCYVCSKEINFTNFEAGHVIASSKGGSDNIDNLVPICSACNKSMGN